MRISNIDTNTIVAFRIGRGGRFNNGGHVTFEGKRNIGDYIANLFWDTDESGNPLPHTSIRDANGREVGITWDNVESGIGTIDLDGEYQTIYTKRISDIEEDSKEWVAIFKDRTYWGKQAQICLRKEFAIQTMDELADFINANNDWDLVVGDIIEYNGWHDETHEDWGVCSDDTQRVSLNEDGKAVVTDID